MPRMDGADRIGAVVQGVEERIVLGAGPAVGGLILDTLGWQWAFWLNVPMGLAGMILGWLVLPQTKTLPATGRFDLYGALLIAPALTAIVAALNDAKAKLDDRREFEMSKFTGGLPLLPGFKLPF